VADARRQPRFEVFMRGQRDAELSRAPEEGVLTALPALPEGFDAATTAAWTQAMLADQAPVPESIAAQVDCLVAALRKLKD
jgi:hypothetical protein